MGPSPEHSASPLRDVVVNPFVLPIEVPHLQTQSTGNKNCMQVSMRITGDTISMIENEARTIARQVTSIGCHADANWYACGVCCNKKTGLMRLQDRTKSWQRHLRRLTVIKSSGELATPTCAARTWKEPYLRQPHTVSHRRDIQVRTDVLGQFRHV